MDRENCEQFYTLPLPDTLASAQAECGQFAEAIATQEGAIAKLRREVGEKCLRLAATEIIKSGSARGNFLAGRITKKNVDLYKLGGSIAAFLTFPQTVKEDEPSRKNGPELKTTFAFTFDKSMPHPEKMRQPKMAKTKFFLIDASIF